MSQAYPVSLPEDNRARWSLLSWRTRASMACMLLQGSVPVKFWQFFDAVISSLVVYVDVDPRHVALKALPMRPQPEVDGRHGWYRSHAGYAYVPQYQVKMNAGNPRSGKYLLCRETRESGLKWPTVRTISTKVTSKGHKLLFLVRIVRPCSCRESPVCEDQHPWKERDTCCALPPRIPEAYWKPRS